MTVLDNAPITERGYPGGIVPAYTAGMGAGFSVEGLDLNVDLRFPASAVVFDRMGREDGQVVSVVRAIVQAIVAARRTLVGTDVRPEVMRFVSDNLGLDEGTGRTRRRRRGIVLTQHRRQAAQGVLRYGFMPFEQTYDVGAAAPGVDYGHADDPARLYAFLRKLGPRNPRTLSEVRVEADGGLAGIVQEPRPGVPAPHGVFIPASQLLMYVNDQEGADWTGTSALRAAYKHWLIKDALMRLGAQVVERNGMGIPVVSYADPADEGRALRLSQAVRAGSTAGAALRQGTMTLDIVGTQGSIVDGLPWVKYHDEAMGRSLLAMVLNLGHDNGARALGATFTDLLVGFINSINRGLDETDTEHLIRDLVELNYGIDEPYPVLVTEDVAAESTPTAEALKALADAGLLTADPVLEADLRRRYTLPAKPEAPAVEEAGADPAVAEVGIPALIDAGVIDAEEARVMLKLPPGAPIQAPGTAPPLVVVPDQFASNLAANRTALRAVLELDGLNVWTAARPGPPGELMHRVAALAERVAALDEGHGRP